MYRILFLLTVLFCLNTSAKIYNQNELSQVIKNPAIQIETQEFVRQFFISQNPQKTINQLIHDKLSDSLSVETKLNAVLTEIAIHSRQTFLQDFITQMKSYHIKAFKMHEEGRLPVAIFDLNAKAEGIENIWTASESLHKYTQLFNSNPIDALKQLSTDIESLSQPEWLGIKQSMSNISLKSQLAIHDYLLEQPDHLVGLDKFISRYVLITADQQVTSMALKQLNAKSQQYLLRKLSSVFADEYVIEQLMQVADTEENAAFALTLLKPYVKTQPQLQTYLIDTLRNKKLSAQAAFALVDGNNLKLLKRLETVYMKSQSIPQKQGIKLVLKLSDSSQSHAITERINVYDLMQEKQGRKQ